MGIGCSRVSRVPYAVPPSGANRMLPPQPVPAWEGERDATAYGPTVPKGDYPPQYAVLFPEVVIPGEDCLTAPDPGRWAARAELAAVRAHCRRFGPAGCAACFHGGWPGRERPATDRVKSRRSTAVPGRGVHYRPHRRTDAGRGGHRLRAHRGRSRRLPGPPAGCQCGGTGHGAGARGTGRGRGRGRGDRARDAKGGYLKMGAME